MTGPDVDTPPRPAGLLLPGPWAPAEDVEPDGDDELSAEPAVVDVAPIPVDRSVLEGEVVAPWERRVEHRPVLAPWLLDPAARRAAMVWAARSALHPVAFHGIRAPIYVLRLVARSPVGFWRVVRVACA